MSVSRTALPAIAANPGSVARLLRLVAVTAAVALWARPAGEPAQRAATPGPETQDAPFVTSPQGLAAIAAAAGHPVYWAGPIPRRKLEVTQGVGGITVRYIPDSARPGDKARRLTVASRLTYQAFAAVKSAATNPDAEVRRLPGGGLAVASRSSGTGAGFSYPRSNVIADVSDPNTGRGLRLVVAGRIRPIGARP